MKICIIDQCEKESSVYEMCRYHYYRSDVYRELDKKRYRNNIEYKFMLSDDEFHVMYSVWVSGEEKLVIDFGVERSTAGAGTAPTRTEFVGKYVPSPLTNTCDRIDGVASTSLAASTNLSETD
jgi:hypothetical protein